ncbi:sensor histidine kinase [Streptomyces sp. TG1A-60]|uniref:sensor histidine kinase n=1 Tax=Streptomyces sp. TG1A-60 TaxID=3129111 RepID=UPI0030D0CBB1
MRSVSPRGCARGVGVGALLALCVGDLALSGAQGRSIEPSLVVLAVGLAALLWPADRRPVWLTLQVRTAVPAVVSLALTVGMALTGHGRLFGPGESVILLCLAFLAVRRLPLRQAVACGALDAVAGLVLPMGYLGLREESVAYLLLGLLWVVIPVTGLAGYLRWREYRRATAVAETRRAERVAIAADLHDFVAHHVTGILVQTQMARMMAASHTDGLDPVLAGIERAATEALASMRRTVGVLRHAGPEAADLRPVGDLAGITDLIQGFASPIHQVTLHRDPSVRDDLPHEVQAAAFRVVQEALTNIRRHAADATEIGVGLRCEDRRLTVTVADDGRGGTQLPDAAHGGGFGLVGLTERVTTVGGTLHAGPRAGHGWEVRADLPLRKPD